LRTSPEGEVTVRKLQSYVKKYGPVAGPMLYHALQSQAAHAGVSARLRRKIARLSAPRPQPPLPLFPEPEPAAGEPTPAAPEPQAGDELCPVVSLPAPAGWSATE
jgi:hypothetical protein